MIRYHAEIPLPDWETLREETMALIVAQADMALGVWLGLICLKNERNYTINIKRTISSPDGKNQRIYVLDCTLRSEHE